MTTRQLSGFVVAAVVLLTAVVVRAGANETEFRGTVVTVEKARVQVRTLDEHGAPTGKLEWFAVAEKTKTLRGEAVIPFAEAQVKADERIVIVVAPGDEAGTEWTCPMHPAIVRPEPGRCPICSMTLRERAKPATASTIRLAPVSSR